MAFILLEKKKLQASGAEKRKTATSYESNQQDQMTKTERIPITQEFS